MTTDRDEKRDGIHPGIRPNCDSLEDFQDCLNPELFQLYDVYSYRHAASILRNSFFNHLKEIEETLLNFRISCCEIAMPGGNESEIPRKISSFLRTKGWKETRIQGDLIVRVIERTEKGSLRNELSENSEPELMTHAIYNYIDGHKIDYVKGRIALDLEWNSKDQTYDRDLYAFRMFHECGLISVAVLITRSEKLNDVFRRLPLLNKQKEKVLDADGNPKMCIQKYGASTTWMGKLLYRLDAGRNGGCPVLVLGIKPGVIIDWPQFIEEL